jgi:transcription initiation factor TFIID subunit 5
MDLQDALLSYLKQNGTNADAAAAQVSDSRDDRLQRERKELAHRVVKLAVQKELPRAADCLMQALREESGDAGRWYEEQYTRLQRWAHQSLEVFRAELTSVLWPIFAHVFIVLIQRNLTDRAQDFFEQHRSEHEELHGGAESDIAALSVITAPSQLPKPWGEGRADVAGTILLHKFEVVMSRTAFTQLLSFLEHQKLVFILHILNAHVRVQIYDEPDSGDGSGSGSKSGSADNVAILQHSVREKNRMGGAPLSRPASIVNKKRIYWGPLPDEKRVSEEARAAAERDQNARRQAARARAEEDGTYSVAWRYEDPNPVRRVESTGPSPEGRELLTQKAEGRGQVLVKQRLSEHIAETAELRSQVTLSRDALPSSCCFTVYNAGSTVNNVSMTSDATVVAASFDDSTVRVWDMRLSKQPQRRDENENNPGAGWCAPAPQVFRGHSGPVYACSVSPDYENVLTCSEDSTVRLWNLELSANLMAYRGHSGPVWDVAYAPLAPFFATASHDRTARLWSVERAAPLRILAGHLSDVDAVCFHDNSHYLATGSIDKAVRLWELRAGPCVRVLSAHTGPVHTLAFSPCGQYLSSAGADGAVIVWDLAAAQVAARLQCTDKTQLGRQIWSLDYSACGKMLSAAHRCVPTSYAPHHLSCTHTFQ